MKHKCKYCGKESNDNRDALVEGGWAFVDIRSPMRKYIKACWDIRCFDKMYDEVSEIMGR